MPQEKLVPDIPSLGLTHIEVNGIRLQVATAGEGPPILLLHGWPHTWFLWHKVMPELARHHSVIAPDLRGIGGSTRAAEGYDLHTQADDMAGLLAALGVSQAVVVGIDAGAPVAWMLAMRRSDLVRRLVVMESLLGALPGGEAFLAKGPPWWFGFHGIPGLAERALLGNEAAYLGWFYTAGTWQGRGISPEAREAFVQAYTGEEALRCGFGYYRALGTNAQQVADAVADQRLTVPTLALDSDPVGDALYKQLVPFTDDLTGHVIPDCGHIIPEDQPEALLSFLLPFAA